MKELLCPAGNFEKMKAAILYGADAVYLASDMFGMRAAADNFTLEELSPYLDECKAEKLFFIHAKPKRYEDIESIKGKYSFEVITPNDNDQYDI